MEREVTIKGVVFTEFMELVEATWGADTVDDIIDAAELPHDGVYTAVGTYPHTEMVSLVVALSKDQGVPVDDLLKVFGRHLLMTFHKSYPAFFEVDGVFDFLENVDGYIHVEVRKLYPDAELPRFATVERTPDKLVLDYKSVRCMSAVAVGLIERASEHFGEPLNIASNPLEADGSEVRFELTRG